MSSKKNLYQHRTGPRLISGRLYPYPAPSRPGRIVSIRRVRSGRTVS